MHTCEKEIYPALGKLSSGACKWKWDWSLNKFLFEKCSFWPDKEVSGWVLLYHSGDKQQPAEFSFDSGS